MAKDTEVVKKAIKNKCTPEQIQAWRYFSNPRKDGCLTKYNHVSDKEFDNLIRQQMAKYGLDTPERAMKKLGIDATDIECFEPIRLEDFIPTMSTAQNLYRRGEDGIIRTSNYQVTWILCSQDEVYLYQCTFSLIEDDKKDKGEEYFFKDVTNFTTIEVSDEITCTETEVTGGCKGSEKEVVNKYKLEKTKFRITVPGERLECAMIDNPQIQEAIKRLKTLLREKKSQ